MGLHEKLAWRDVGGGAPVVFVSLPDSLIFWSLNACQDTTVKSGALCPNGLRGIGIVANGRDQEAFLYHEAHFYPILINEAGRERRLAPFRSRNKLGTCRRLLPLKSRQRMPHTYTGVRHADGGPYASSYSAAKTCAALCPTRNLQDRSPLAK